MDIRFQIFEESNMDIDSLIGDLTLSDSQCAFTINDTYLDSWFSAFIDRLDDIHSSRKVAVQIEEEPDPIIVDSTTSPIEIFYQNTKITVATFEELHASIYEATKNFFATATKYVSIGNNDLLVNIQRFLIPN